MEYNISSLIQDEKQKMIREQAPPPRAEPSSPKVGQIDTTAAAAIATAETNKEYLRMISDPQKAVELKLGQKIGEMIEEPDGDAAKRVNTTAEKVIDTTLKKSETKAEGDSEQAFFERYEADLANGGVIAPAEQWYMDKVVKCAKRWKLVWYYTFGWWIIGAGTWADSVKPLKKPLKVFAWIGLFAAIAAIITVAVLSILLLIK